MSLWVSKLKKFHIFSLRESGAPRSLSEGFLKVTLAAGKKWFWPYPNGGKDQVGNTQPAAGVGMASVYQLAHVHPS